MLKAVTSFNLSRVFIPVFLVVGIIDLTTKQWVWANRPDLSGLHMFERVTFHFHQNSGYMLGMGSNLSPDSRHWILGTFSIVLIALLLMILLRRGFSHPVVATAWAMVLGGGLANQIERFYRAAVTDFLQVDFGFFKTGLFNLADLINLCGLILIGFSILLYSRIH